MSSLYLRFVFLSLQAISDELEAGEPLLLVNSQAGSVLQHTSPQGQTAIRHDMNNAGIELDMAKTEAKQKLSNLDDIIHKLKVGVNEPIIIFVSSIKQQALWSSMTLSKLYFELKSECSLNMTVRIFLRR